MHGIDDFLWNHSQLDATGWQNNTGHDDIITWKHFPHYWTFVQGIHWSPVNSPHKGQWCRALMFSLIWVWINAWVNNCKAGDLRYHHTHHDTTVMWGTNPFPEPIMIKFYDAIWHCQSVLHSNNLINPMVKWDNVTLNKIKLCHNIDTVETLYSTIFYSKYFIELNIDKSTQYVALWTHKRHPIPRPFGRAMECLLWVLQQKLIVL